MSKLNKVEKKERKALKKELAAMGGEIFNFHASGVCVVFLPSCPNSDREKVRFVRASVAICSGSDTYSRKRGELVALTAIWAGESIPVQVRGEQWSSDWEEAAGGLVSTVA